MRRYCQDCTTRDICRTFGACYVSTAAKRKPRIRAKRVQTLQAIPQGPRAICPEEQAKREIDYWGQCNAAGGFPIAVVTQGRTWWQNAAGEVWRAL